MIRLVLFAAAFFPILAASAQTGAWDIRLTRNAMPRAHHLIELFKRKAFASFRFTQPLLDSRPRGQKFRGLHFVPSGLEECSQSLLYQGIGAGEFAAAELFFDSSLDRGIECDLHRALIVPPYFFSGSRPERPKKPVSILPAMKSGWDRIFWCRGIEV